MPHRCLPWSKSEIRLTASTKLFWIWLPAFEEPGYALAVSSGVAYRCRLVTLEGPARLHQLGKAWKRWRCPCLHNFSLKTSSVEVFDWARFQFNSYNSSSNVNEPSGRLANLLFLCLCVGSVIALVRSLLELIKILRTLYEVHFVTFAIYSYPFDSLASLRCNRLQTRSTQVLENVGYLG